MAISLVGLHALPILGSTADLVLLPHVLEFSDNPHQVLREVARMLKCTEATVRSHIANARIKFRKYLERRKR